MYPAHLVRVSDAEREGIVAQLGVATAEGRLTLDEFSERTQHAYAARTWGELVGLVADLPKPTAPIVPAPTFAAPPATSASGTNLSLIAMILGIVSIVAIGCVPVGGVAGLAGIVLGIMGSRAADRGESSHRGFALAGIVCGSLGVLLSMAWMGFLVVLG
jgi:hypothetical protein